MPMNEFTEEFVGYWTRHQAEVKRYVFKLVPRSVDVDDILQLTATGLWRKFESYDRERPFVAWAIRFAYIEVLAWRQRQSRDRLVFSDKVLALVGTTIEEEAPLLELRRRELERCMGKLSQQDRELISKRYAHRGSVKDQAEQTGVSNHKLYYRIEKIRHMLMVCIGQSMAREEWQHG